MQKFRRKKLLITIGIFYAAFNVINLMSQEVRLQRYQVRLDLDMENVAQENQKLQKSLRYYQTETGVREIARQRLGYYQKDEVPIRVIQSKGN